MPLKRICPFLFLVLCASSVAHGQAGISASPLRFYYELPAGGTETQTITVINPTDRELEVGVSFADWNYEEDGNNRIFEAGTLETSCADWIQVLPSSYFVLQPRERKKLDIVLNVPQGGETQVPVHTAVLFLTQLNPIDSRESGNGAAIKVTVRMGVKIYHGFFPNAQPNIEIIDFNTIDSKAKEGKTSFYMVLENQGKTWTNGKVAWELFNKGTGKKTKPEKTEFHTLPGDKRRLELSLPADMEKGEYLLTAIVKYGDSDVIKIAELEFSVK